MPSRRDGFGLRTTTVVKKPYITTTHDAMPANHTSKRTRRSELRTPYDPRLTQSSPVAIRGNPDASAAIETIPVAITSAK